MRERVGKCGNVLLMIIVLMSEAFLLGGCGQTAYEAVASGQYIYSVETLRDQTEESVPDGQPDRSDQASEIEVIKETEIPDEMICVYVCGAVAHSGVVELPEGARAYEAIEAAGGLTPDADDRQLNQAMVLSDGDQITVLTKDEAKDIPLSSLNEGAGGSQRDSSSGKVNINTADAAALQKLSGIGAAKAADIIAYRTENGAFQTIEDIMKVSGIKNSLFNRIRDDITVG